MTESDDVRTRILVATLRRWGYTQITSMPVCLGAFIKRVEIGVSAGKVTDDAARIQPFLIADPRIHFICVLTGDDGITRLYHNDADLFEDFMDMCREFNTVV